MKIMTDEKIRPQNMILSSIDRDGANRVELISGELEKPLKRCLPFLVPLTRTMRTWGVKDRMRCADPFEEFFNFNSSDRTYQFLNSIKVRSMLNVATENPYFIRAVWQGEKVYKAFYCNS